MHFSKNHYITKRINVGLFNDKAKALVVQRRRNGEFNNRLWRGHIVSVLFFSFLPVSQEKWFCVTQPRRQKHIYKFHSCLVCHNLCATTQKESITSSDISIGQCTTIPEMKLLSKFTGWTRQH
uniref:Uncharacterized protein n=1 Tax=Amphimedon queenslandica TaxID=400682 RepID=A0A1X7VHY4_AMPQE